MRKSPKFSIFPPFYVNLDYFPANFDTPVSLSEDDSCIGK